LKSLLDESLPAVDKKKPPAKKVGPKKATTVPAAPAAAARGTKQKASPKAPKGNQTRGGKKPSAKGKK
jgi:hypothetical protein